MGLREKVALILTVIMLLQVIVVTSSSKSKTPKGGQGKPNQKRSTVTTTHPLIAITTYPNIQSLKTQSKQPSDISQEAIRKAFNFPDTEYPCAPLPRPEFYLQDTNAMKRNQLQTPTDSSSINPSSPIDSSNKSKKYNNKKYDLAKLKAKKSTRIPKTFPEVCTTSKPFCYREGIFPEVEYPLSVWDTWKPNYWPLTPCLDQKKNNIESNFYSKVAKKLKSFTIPKSKSLKKSKDNIIRAPDQFDLTESTVSTAKPDESEYKRNDMCSNILNQTLSGTSIPIKTPSDVSSDDSSSVSPLKIHNDDKTTTVSSDNKIASITDVINTIVFESTDNMDSCVEDNVVDSNKSFAFDVDEEFTTDVMPDFDENILSVSTSTMSPISLVDIDEVWANDVITNPWSEAEPDELEECYILLS